MTHSVGGVADECQGGGANVAGVNDDVVGLQNLETTEVNNRKFEIGLTLM